MRLLIILCGHHPSRDPRQIGAFHWVEGHQCYAWQGRELKPQEFNRVVDGVLERARESGPQLVTIRSI